jgi:hypothetical protein
MMAEIRSEHLSNRSVELYYYTNLLSLSLYLPLPVKRFVSQFLNPKTVSRTPWTGISPSQGRYLTQTQKQCGVIHALSEIRTHDPSVPASEEYSCLRLRGHCDRLVACSVLHYMSVNATCIISTYEPAKYDTILCLLSLLVAQLNLSEQIPKQWTETSLLTNPINIYLYYFYFFC